MTNDKQVEVWQSEFESLSVSSGMTTAIFHKKPSGLGYIDFNTDCLWTGFLMAKRSMQPVIEIDQLSRYGSTDDILACITEAGYSYRVK